MNDLSEDFIMPLKVASNTYFSSESGGERQIDVISLCCCRKFH